MKRKNIINVAISCHTYRLVQCSEYLLITLHEHVSPKQVDLPKLLVCPTVCTTLGLMLLKIRVRRLQEANMGVKVISSDIYINVNSDIYIVLV